MQLSEKKINILVVDDEKIITMHLDELLTNMGYNVIGIASNGIEAIKKSKELSPDLILMDIIMPGELTGIDAAKEIKNEMQIPVIFLSAFADDKLVNKAKISEPYSYIVKPFQSQELKAAIEIALYKKELENKLIDAEEKYRTLVEESRDGIGIIQGDGFKYINPALSDMLGNPDNITEISIMNSFTGDCQERMEEIYEKCMGGEHLSIINECTLQQENGSFLPVETNATLISYDKEPAILSFFRDISERKYMKDMVDYLVNEINESNQIIIPNIEKIKDRMKDSNLNELIEHVLFLMLDNANKLKKVYSLLQIEYQPRTFYSVDLVEHINNAISVITNQFKEEDVQINTHINGKIPNIMADEFIEDIIHILLENSIEFNENKLKKINVFVEKDRVKKPKFVLIKIEDNGKGIPDDKKIRIFESPITNRFKKNTGLGLTIAKTVTKNYSGEIWVEDRIEGDHRQGSNFIIKLPI
jgi:PAS domain S-box-containing protein